MTDRDEIEFRAHALAVELTRHGVSERVIWAALMHIRVSTRREALDDALDDVAAVFGNLRPPWREELEGRLRERKERDG